MSQLVNESVSKVFVEQPQLHGDYEVLGGLMGLGGYGGSMWIWKE